MVMDTCPAIEWPRLGRRAPDGLAADPPRRHRRDAARAAGRRPVPLAGGPRLRRDPRLGRRAEPAQPRAPGRPPVPRVVPPHHDRHRRPPARGHPRQGRRPLRRQPQRRLAAAGPLVRRRHPRRARGSGGRLLLDPNTFSEDGTSSLAGYNASKDGRWLAYLVSDGGSDWSTIRLLDLAGGHEVDDVVTQGEVQRGDLAARPLVLPLPATTRPRAPASAPRRPRCRAASCAGTTCGEPQDDDELVLELPENPPAEHDPEAVARRPLARVAHPRGHLGEEPALVLPGADRRRRQRHRRAAQGRRRGRRGLRPRCASTATRSTCGPTSRRRWAGWSGSTSRRSPTPAAPSSSTSSPRATPRCEGVRAVGDELLAVHLVDVQPRLTRYALDGIDARHGRRARRRGGRDERRRRTTTRCSSACRR